MINKKDTYCKECGSSQTHIKFSENVRVCHVCGHKEKLNIKELKGMQNVTGR